MANSWKSIGGMTHLSHANNINTNTLTANRIYLREAYAGDFSITGNLHVDVDTDIAGNLLVQGDTTLQNTVITSLDVSNTAIFSGDVSMNRNVYINNGTINNLTTINNTTVGKELYLQGSTTNGHPKHYFYGTDVGIGLDTHTPAATLDVASTQQTAMKIATTNATNRNILAQNSTNQGVVLSAYSGTSSVDFYTASTVDVSNPVLHPDSTISCTSDGMMHAITSNRFHVKSDMTISGTNQTTTAPIDGESLTIYDNNDGNYLPDIFNPTHAFGKSAAMVAKPQSTTFINFSDANGVGAAIGGGIFPGKPANTMYTVGLTDNSGVFLPTQTVISADVGASKYLSTMGINTCTPKNNTYVLDINGPIHIDNGDIVQTYTSPNYEFIQMDEGTYAPSHVMALCASIDASNTYIYQNRVRYRYNIMYSNNGGGLWQSTMVVPTGSAPGQNDIVKGNNLNAIDVYDASYAFVTGDNNTLAYTNNGGVTWRGLGQLNITNTVSFSAVKCKTSPLGGGYLRVYAGIDGSGNANNSYFGYFDVSTNVLLNSTSAIFVNMNIYPTLGKVISIGLGPSRVYMTTAEVSANPTTHILTYLESNLSVIEKQHEASQTANPVNAIPEQPYQWTRINVYDNNYAVAVGYVYYGIGNPGIDFAPVNMGVISTTHDGGVTWTDYTTFLYSYYDAEQYYHEFYGTKLPYECILRDVRIIDSSNIMVVGNLDNHGFILLSQNGGLNWDTIDIRHLNASGKQNLLIGTPRYLTNVNMIDNQTFLFSRTLTFADSVGHTDNGSSNIYSALMPHYLNWLNNNVLDIMGNISVYGNISMKTYGNTISTEASTFNLASTATTVNIGKLTSVVGTVKMGNVNCTSLTQTSDYRIKTDVVDIGADDTATVDGLRPVKYNNTMTGMTEMGFIAHEVQAEFPFMVDGVVDGEQNQGLRYTNMIALLVKEIQVLKKQVRELQEQQVHPMP